jgi:hypothetical protein
MEISAVSLLVNRILVPYLKPINEGGKPDNNPSLSGRRLNAAIIKQMRVRSGKDLCNFVPKFALSGTVFVSYQSLSPLLRYIHSIATA